MLPCIDSCKCQPYFPTLQELQRLSRELKELQIVSRRAIEAASSALGIPLHGDDRGDLAVDQLVDTLILQLQVRCLFRTLTSIVWRQ